MNRKFRLIVANYDRKLDILEFIPQLFEFRERLIALFDQQRNVLTGLLLFSDFDIQRGDFRFLFPDFLLVCFLQLGQLLIRIDGVANPVFKVGQPLVDRRVQQSDLLLNAVYRLNHFLFMIFHCLFLSREFLIESFDFFIESLRGLIDFRVDSRNIRLVLLTKPYNIGFDVGNPGIKFRLVGLIFGIKFAVLFLKSGDVPFMGCLDRFQFCLMPRQLFAQSGDLLIQFPIGVAQAIDFGVQFRFQTGKTVIQLPGLFPIPVFGGKLLLTQIGHGAVDFVVQRRILLVDLRLQRGNITRMRRFQIRNPVGQRQLIQLQYIDLAF